MRYIPSSPDDRREMLDAIGISSVEQLFDPIPETLRISSPPRVPGPMTEPELVDYFRSIASRNRSDISSFLGAGVYAHYIPTIADALVSRSEFYTAYTPYQAEVAQGTLQALFEFQTYVTQLTGMDVANASLYDGGTALAEAVLMTHRLRPRKRFLIARSVHPEYRSVVETYTRRFDLRVETIDFAADGRIDFERLESALGPEIAGVAIQSPNFFGTIEDTRRIAEMAHAHDALSVVAVAEAMSFGLLQPPGAAPPAGRADIVCGEAQSFGIPAGFGGPHLGFIAAREDYLRQMPGRLVGMGHDGRGRRAFVLTLSTREQHIRREKATSNICTNQSLCAVVATVYLAAVGPRGLHDIAAQNALKLNYFIQCIEKHTDHQIRFAGPRFNEVLLTLSGELGPRIQRLRRDGIVGGLQADRFFADLENSLLVCVTEKHRKEEIDALVEGLA